MAGHFLLKTLILAQLTSTTIAQQMPSLDKDDIFWLSIKDKREPALFEDYLEKFPRGMYVKIACHDLAQLRGTATLPAPCISPEMPAAPPASVASPTVPAGLGAMELLRLVQQVVGGSQRLAEVRDFRMTERLQARGLMGGKGNRSLAWCSSGGFLEVAGKTQTYFDGKSAGWYYDKAYFWPISLAVGRRYNFFQWFHLLLADSQPDHKVTPVGPNTLQIEDGFGNLAILEINPDSHLPVKLRPSATAEPTTYSDWRDVGGFKLPFHETISRKEMTSVEGTLSWGINTGINCAALDRKPAGAKEAKSPPKTPESPAADPPLTLTEDTAQRAIEMVKRLQDKLGGTEALLQVRDFERRFRESKPLPNGEMSKGTSVVETGCITGELHQKTTTRVRRAGMSFKVDVDVFFDGNQSAWIKRGRRYEKLPNVVTLDLRRAQFNYDIFNVALSDRLPGRVLSLPNDQTIQIIDETGSRASITVDSATGLPSRKESRFVGRSGSTAPVDEYFSDWKPVGGVLLPHHLAGYRNGRLEREVQVEEWKLNTGARCSELGRPPAMAKATR
jgi:hypothetical protein